MKTFHIILSTLAFAIFCFATLQALLLALQEQQLKHKRLTGIIQRLPPLETMERFLFQTIYIGFSILSMVILTSFLSFDNIFSPHLIRKTIYAFLAWAMFAGLLLGRHYLGWRSKTAIRWTLGSFLLLIIVYFWSNL